jgi:hypothetical protein
MFVAGYVCGFVQLLSTYGSRLGNIRCFRDVEVRRIMSTGWVGQHHGVQRGRGGSRGACMLVLWVHVGDVGAYAGAMVAYWCCACIWAAAWGRQQGCSVYMCICCQYAVSLFCIVVLRGRQRQLCSLSCVVVLNLLSRTRQSTGQHWPSQTLSNQDEVEPRLCSCGGGCCGDGLLLSHAARLLYLPSAQFHQPLLVFNLVLLLLLLLLAGWHDDHTEGP